jgi:hypothetical protein
VVWPRWAARHRIGSAGGRWSWMDEPVHGILGRDAELAEVESFVGSGSGGPSALLLEGPAGIGKTTLWRAGVSFARARGHRVLSCRAAEAEARLSYAALGDLFDFELPDLPAPQRRALDACAPPSRGPGCATGPAGGVARVAGRPARPGRLRPGDHRDRRCPVAGCALGQGAGVRGFVVWRTRHGSWWPCASVPAATRSPWVA